MFVRIAAQALHIRLVIPERSSPGNSFVAAIWRLTPDRGEQEVSPLNINIQIRKLIFKGIDYKALRCQMITFIRPHLLNYMKEAGGAPERRRMEIKLIQDVADAPDTEDGIFKGHKPYRAMDRVPLVKLKFRELRSILTCDSGNEGFFLFIDVLSVYARIPCRRLEIEKLIGNT